MANVIDSRQEIEETRRWLVEAKEEAKPLVCGRKSAQEFCIKLFIGTLEPPNSVILAGDRGDASGNEGCPRRTFHWRTHAASRTAGRKRL
jgi:hypothetical protein